jgi:hypothetical protein
VNGAGNEIGVANTMEEKEEITMNETLASAAEPRTAGAREKE